MSSVVDQCMKSVAPHKIVDRSNRQNRLPVKPTISSTGRTYNLVDRSNRQYRRPVGPTELSNLHSSNQCFLPRPATPKCLFDLFPCRISKKYFSYDSVSFCTCVGVFSNPFCHVSISYINLKVSLNQQYFQWNNSQCM
jgi:hypothetical protein